MSTLSQTLKPTIGPPFSSVVQLPVGPRVDLDTALMNFDETTITVGAPGQVSGWTNRGTAGASHDLTLLGLAGDLIVGSLNGRTAIEYVNANAGLDSAVFQVITVPYTLFAVAHLRDAAPGTEQQIVDSNGGVGRTRIFIDTLAADTVWNDSGAAVTLTVSNSYDLQSHLFTLRHENTATDFLEVSGFPRAIGVSGGSSWNYGKVGVRFDGIQSIAPAEVGQLVLFQGLTSDSFVANVQQQLRGKWGI